MIVFGACWMGVTPALADSAVAYLDVAHPTLVQAIEPADRAAEGSKFVQVEVVKVENPKAYPAMFTVDYLTSAQERIPLGSFSLYPSDNPGRFIVATRGKLRNEGAIVVTLVVPDGFKHEDVLRIGIGKVTFRKE